MSSVTRKRLGDVINLKRGYDLPANKRTSGSYPVISSSGVSGYHNEYKVAGKGVVTGRYGTLGEVYFAEDKYWPHNTALYVQDFKGNDERYVYYLLKLLGRIRTSDKSTVPGVNRNELHEMLVPVVTDAAEQKRIGEVLSSIDKKIETNKKINKKLDASMRLLYDYWFVQFDFPNITGKPYKSSGGKMIYNEILKRDLPEGWSVMELDDVISRSATGLNPRNNFKLGSGDNYYVTIKNVEDGKIVLDDRCDKIDDDALKIINRRSDLQPGDVLFTSIEPVGITYLVRETPKNWNINESVFTLRPNYNLVTAEYLLMLLSSSEMKAFTANVAYGSIHKGIRHSVLKTFKVAYGNKTLTEKYADSISPMLQRIDRIDQENRELSELRDWLLLLLMNGQARI